MARRSLRVPGRWGFTLLATSLIALLLFQPPTAEATDPRVFAPPHANWQIVAGCDYAGLACAAPGSYHVGVDSVGSSTIRSIGAGVVAALVANGSGDHGLGNTVIVRHLLADGTTIYSLYGHLASIDAALAVGGVVRRGQSIGIMGGSGYGDPNYWGVHLHLEMKSSPVLGDPASPNAYYGYTPTHPDGWGYRNPHDFIGSEVALDPVQAGAGDWNGDGVDGVFKRTGSTFEYFGSGGTNKQRCDQQFGLETDIGIVGDWDGDGIATAGVYRPSDARFHLSNDSATCGALGAADITLAFGLPEFDTSPIVGDWDADDLDNVGLFRESDPEAGGIARFHLGPDRDSGPESQIPFGDAGDLPFTGDWDADGLTEIGVYRDPGGTNPTAFFDYDLGGGGAECQADVGIPGDVPFAGVWPGQSGAKLAIYRPTTGDFFAPAAPVAPGCETVDTIHIQHMWVRQIVDRNRVIGSVIIGDNLGGRTQNATVTARWTSGGVLGPPQQAVTNSHGRARFLLRAPSPGLVKICAEGVTHPQLPHDPGQDSVQCAQTTWPSPSTMHVRMIVLVPRLDRNVAFGSIYVRDNQLNKVAGATVSARWSYDGVNGPTLSSNTNSAGRAAFKLRNPAPGVELALCRTAISHATLVHEPADDLEICDSVVWPAAAGVEAPLTRP